MDRVEVTFTGYNRVNNQLRAAASFYRKEADSVIEKHVKKQAERFRNKAYPPELPNQRYRRTYELKRRYRAQKRGLSQWAIINLRKGAIWVIKRGMQAKIHRDRWYTIEGEAEKSAPMLTKNLAQELEQLLSRQRD